MPPRSCVSDHGAALGALGHKPPCRCAPWLPYKLSALADVETTDENYFAALGSRRDAFLADLATLNSANSDRGTFAEDAITTKTSPPHERIAHRSPVWPRHR